MSSDNDNRKKRPRLTVAAEIAAIVAVIVGLAAIWLAEREDGPDPRAGQAPSPLSVEAGDK